MFREDFLFCEGCYKVTRWALQGDENGVEGECEECELEVSFDDWNEVVGKSKAE